MVLEAVFFDYDEAVAAGTASSIDRCKGDATSEARFGIHPPNNKETASREVAGSGISFGLNVLIWAR